MFLRVFGTDALHIGFGEAEPFEKALMRLGMPLFKQRVPLIPGGFVEADFFEHVNPLSDVHRCHFDAPFG